MMGSLYYEVTASGRRVALCVDKADAEMVASHWYDGQVRETHVFILEDVDPLVPGFTQTYTLGVQTGGTPKRKEE